MTLQTFFQKFDQFADAPNAVAKMRELVLDLAIQGRLIERKASDGDGHSLLKKLRTLLPERNSKSRSPKDIVVEPETPLEIPSHWALTTVENTTRETGFFSDGDWVESKDQDPDGDVRLIQLADVGDGQYRDRSSRFMTKAAATRLNCSYLEAGDVLVARMPDPLGRCCRFPGDSKPAVTVVDVCILRPNVSFFDPGFLVVAINCPRFRRLTSAQATGTTRSRISRSNLGVLPIPLPPLAEQKRIVAKVDELMALCDRLDAQQQERETRHTALARASLARFADAPTPTNLNFLFHKSYTIPPADLRKSILTLAVQGKLVPQDPKDEPAERWFQKIAKPNPSSESALGEPPFPLPHGWIWLRVASVFEVAGGIQKTPHRTPRSNAFPYVGVANVYRGRLDLTHVKQFELDPGELERRRLAVGDLLIIEGNGSFNEIGRCAKWNGEIKNCVHQNHVIRCRPCDLRISDFVLLFLNSPNGTGIMQRLAITSSGLYSLSVGKIRQIEVPIPPLAEQRRIVAKVDQLMALVDQLETQLAASRATAEKLLEAVVAELTTA